MSKLLALVTGEELRAGKKNPFWQMDLKTTTGMTRALIWDVSDPQKESVPRKGDLIQIDLSNDGVKDQRESKYNNIVLVKTACVKVAKSDVKQEVLDQLLNMPKASQKQLEHAYKVLTDKGLYRDIDHFAFVMACMAALPKERLFSCPAGKAVHHAFSGGLIVHTAEIVEICKGVVATFPYPQFIDRDVVFAGATLHDLGKVLTYRIDSVGQPENTTEEYTLGHLYYGMTLAEKVGKERNIDPAWLNEVLHVIASHHNRPEYGAIVEPASVEAIIVSQADYLGSRAGILDSQLATMKKNKTLTENVKAYGSRYVMGNAIKKWFDE